MNTLTPTIIRRPPGVEPVDLSSDRYQCGFEAPSDSTPGKVYTCSFDTAQRCWVCDCTGNINHGHCKHLTRQNCTPTRREIKMLAEAASATSDLRSVRPVVADAARETLQNILKQPLSVEPTPAGAKRIALSPKLVMVRMIALDEEV
jgi:hypothetical protein